MERKVRKRQNQIKKQGELKEETALGGEMSSGVNDTQCFLSSGVNDTQSGDELSELSKFFY